MSSKTRSKKPSPKATTTERREGPDRRSGEDRRMFPRPEGRRASGGRRKNDGSEA